MYANPYLSTFNHPKSGDCKRFTFGSSFAACCLVHILATRGQVSSLTWEWQGCPTVALSHQRATRASKRATNQKLKALFNWEVFVKRDRLSLSDVSFEFFLAHIVIEKNGELHLVMLSIDWSWS